MPRKSRIEAPGAMHHIIVRGIDRQKILKNDEDRDHFLSRLGIILTETKTDCYAWALIPNHFHLLLRTGNVSISTTMRRLLKKGDERILGDGEFVESVLKAANASKWQINICFLINKFINVIRNLSSTYLPRPLNLRKRK